MTRMAFSATRTQPTAFDGKGRTWDWLSTMATGNNILLSGTAIGGVHGHTVFLDEEAPDEERFKIVFIKPVGAEWWVHGGTSGDGIHWHLIEEPLLKKNSDTKIVCFRDGQLYRLYVRMWTGDLGQGDLYQGKRVVGYTQSPTFGAFPDPQVILQPDEHDPPRMDFYDSAATKLREDLYIIFPTAFYQDENVTRPHAAVSNDGINFSRIGSEPMLELGKGFDSKGIYVAPGPIPGEEPGTYWFYYLGTHIGHDQNLPGKVHAAGGYGRFLVRISE